MADLSLRDAPVQDPSDCSLGLADYAEVLYEFMTDCETPLTIGIQGDWGSGKTSLINMIQTRLDNRTGKSVRTPYVNFNTWQYSLFGQEQTLPVACIRSLVQQIEELVPKGDKGLADKAREKVDSLTGLLGAAAKSVSVGVGPVSLSAKDVTEEASQGHDDEPDFRDIGRLMVDFKNQFSEFVQLIRSHSNSDRIVIFIDDLDRVKPVRALELLEVLKNFLDVHGCVFVLAVDYEIVQVGMEQKLGKSIQESSGKSFFDKIINVPFNIPTTSYQLGDYIEGLLNESGFMNYDLDEEEKDFYEQVTSVTVGRNPRNIKRVINYAELLDRIRRKSLKETDEVVRKSKRDMRILYALMCMQIEWPELFGYFADQPTAQTVKNLEDWEFLESRPEARAVMQRASDAQQVKSDIGAFVDELFRELDEDDDGQISHREMEPVLHIMKYAKLTTAETAKTPLEQLADRVSGYGGTGQAEFIESVLRNSPWGDNGACEYKQSGARYWSIVLDRKQVGSMVTLKSKSPNLIFRLKPDKTTLIDHLEQLLADSGFSDSLSTFERYLTPIEDPSLTGFGQTRVKTEDLAKLKSHKARTILDWLHRAIVRDQSAQAVSLSDLAVEDKSKASGLSGNSQVSQVIAEN